MGRSLEEKGTGRARPDLEEASGGGAWRLSGLCDGWRILPKGKKTTVEGNSWPSKYMFTQNLGM